MTKKLLTIICMAIMLTACSNADSSTAVTTPAGQTTTTTTTESEPVEELTTTTTTSEEQSVTTTTTTTETEPTVTTTPEEVTTTTTAETTKPKVTTTTKKPTTTTKVTTTTAKKTTTTTTTTTKKVEEVLIPMYIDCNVYSVYSRPYTSYDYEIDWIYADTPVLVVKGSETVEERFGKGTMCKIYYDNGKSGYIGTGALCDCTISQYYEKHAQLINEHRAELGLNTLAIDEKLTAAAQKRAEEVTTYHSHTRPDGTMCFTVLDEFGIESSSSGEILTIANDYSLSPWIASKEHYAIMTSEKYDTMGVGVAYGDGSLWIVVMFIS